MGGRPGCRIRKWGMKNIAFLSMNLAERSFQRGQKTEKAMSLPFESGCIAVPIVGEGRS